MSREVSGFFWCEGPRDRPELWTYCAIILERDTHRTTDYRADGPDDLRYRLAEDGYQVAADLKLLCESAPRSPRIGRRKVGGPAPQESAQ